MKDLEGVEENKQQIQAFIKLIKNMSDKDKSELSAYMKNLKSSVQSVDSKFISI